MLTVVLQYREIRRKLYEIHQADVGAYFDNRKDAEWLVLR